MWFRVLAFLVLSGVPMVAPMVAQMEFNRSPQSETRGGSRSETCRIAVPLLGGDESGEVTKELRRQIGAEVRLPMELIDPELTGVALRGTGFDGSLNLSLTEARGLGQSLGADYFMLGRLIETRRQQGGDLFGFDSLAGLFLVESRTGRLLRFVEVNATGSVEAQVHGQLLGKLPGAWSQMVGAIAEAERLAVEAMPVDAGQDGSPVVFSDLSEIEGGAGTLPVFVRQLKPIYPESAARSEVVATVEVMALFQADGTVREVEIKRWGGYGLDESAVSTVRQLRFRPATQDGRPVSFRGLVRYNFRRPTPQAIRSSVRSREELEQLRNSLRDILKTRPIP
ncbi:MAG: energy transducer TonB [Blastocatellia bacterium]